MTQKHTTGPWFLSQIEGAQPGEGHLVVDGGGFTICHTDQTRNEEANARLIAAAPDYDDAARFAVLDAKHYGKFSQDGKIFYSMTEEAFKKLEAAITKAEGK